jgi:hypothetical protein
MELSITGRLFLRNDKTQASTKLFENFENRLKITPSVYERNAGEWSDEFFALLCTVYVIALFYSEKAGDISIS